MSTELELYQIDSFTEQLFCGNPAAVVPLDSWLPDDLMQSIALENNLSETAFFVAEGDGYHLRWFTPTDEMDLCGHATLAAAYVLFHHLNYGGDQVRFSTLSGDLVVSRDPAGLLMDFPSRPVTEQSLPDEIINALGAKPIWSGAGKNWLLLYETEQQVKALAPDFAQLLTVSDKNIIVTAISEEKGRDDFVSRFFAPHVGINEDPVTGSAHCSLIPFWAGRLGLNQLRARQVSARGGELVCTLDGDRVKMAGQCVTYMRGQFSIAAG